MGLVLWDIQGGTNIAITALVKCIEIVGAKKCYVTTVDFKPLTAARFVMLMGTAFVQTATP
jgi:hypothetical protein